MTISEYLIGFEGGTNLDVLDNFLTSKGAERLAKEILVTGILRETFFYRLGNTAIVSRSYASVNFDEGSGYDSIKISGETEEDVSSARSIIEKGLGKTLEEHR